MHRLSICTERVSLCLKAALRIYTTHLFKYLNGPLRDGRFGKGKRAHPLPLTMAYVSEGTKKLRAVYVKEAKEQATTAISLWRGMRDVDVTDKSKPGDICRQ